MGKNPANHCLLLVALSCYINNLQRFSREIGGRSVSFLFESMVRFNPVTRHK
jgi:hypothetical protein